MKKTPANLVLWWHFRNESKIAKQLAFERPKHWQYLLTHQLLRDWLTKWKPLFDTNQPTKLAGRAFSCQPEFHYWAVTQMIKVGDLLAGNVTPALQELIIRCRTSVGPGDAVCIKKSAVKLDGVCQQMLKWKQEVYSARFPRNREKAQSMMMGWELQQFQVVEDYCRQLSAIVANPQPGTEQMVTVKLDLPRGDEFGRELERVTNSLPEDETYATPEAVTQKAELDRLMDRFSRRQKGS